MQLSYKEKYVTRFFFFYYMFSINLASAKEPPSPRVKVVYKRPKKPGVRCCTFADKFRGQTRGSFGTYQVNYKNHQYKKSFRGLFCDKKNIYWFFQQYNFLFYKYKIVNITIFLNYWEILEQPLHLSNGEKKHLP